MFNPAFFLGQLGGCMALVDIRLELEGPMNLRRVSDVSLVSFQGGDRGPILRSIASALRGFPVTYVYRGMPQSGIQQNQEGTKFP